MKLYDAIVLGVGGVGSAALYHLARRGVRVVGVDRFVPPHDQGSTHGQSRVIRQAYFEHPNYVPLLLESYRLWRTLEAASESSLLNETGLVEVGASDGTVIPGVLQAAKIHGLPVECLGEKELGERWPGLRVGEGLVGVFEPTGGYLLVEKCVCAHLQVAKALGAELLTNTVVSGWSADEHEVRVRTSAGELVAERLIVAAGAWASGLLDEISLQLEVRRKSIFWLDSQDPKYCVESGFPVFLFELPDGVYYGFPQLDSRGVKIAEHSGGQIIPDPLEVDREIDEAERQRIVDFASLHLPGVSSRVREHAVCLYTMSPDEHLIVDRHPAHANVVFAAGLSGHGFKFVPVLGRALAELALDGACSLPVEFLSLARFT